jgi:hypothetical protein
MPYGYFQLVRFTALIGFSILAYFAKQQEEPVQVIIYIGLAVLFQPLFKIALGRTVWNVVDVVVAIGLFFSIFVKPKKTIISSIIREEHTETTIRPRSTKEF